MKVDLKFGSDRECLKVVRYFSCGFCVRDHVCALHFPQQKVMLYQQSLKFGKKLIGRYYKPTLKVKYTLCQEIKSIG